MKYGIKALDDFDFSSKTVIARLDLNCPYDPGTGKLKDITRIKAAIPTIRELSKAGAKLVILTHQGGDLEYHNYISTELHAGETSKLLGKDVKFIDDVCGPAARKAIRQLNPGQILLLDNVRYMAEEMTLFEAKLKLTPREQAKTIVVRKLAPMADIYICDAFAAAHRDQPTLVGFEEVLPSGMGRLFEKEYGILSKIMKEPGRPLVFLLGGAKIEDAFNMMGEVLSKGIADRILSTGLLGQVFLMAKGISLGAKTEEVIYAKKLDSYLGQAEKMLAEHGDKIMVPLDLAYDDNGRKEIAVDGLPVEQAITDIGSKTIDLYKDIIGRAKTVFINGPAGVFEEPETEKGTRELFSHTAEVDCFSVIGGGDSISAANRFVPGGGFSYMCTGGGAMVRFLSGEELPVVKALKRAARIFV
ncbi:MAG: phosphoglycerate kinase [Actinomycetia bacterium]|nr:phosphoglycerate kinase [Actinomycetes bacterium]